ncbi:hypothetical protein E1B28_010102 [Marasmius oreades]|uniref:Uncharacterized protein n=1 Tax=Marasmius oreades TaxID=181124 RepID=A0A9P7RX37_9AGAR|nr:uncharacterized protein E1B28_010102 [Marasmius oreades]KAG7091042.1 hypothetical protein E1B28_010102 [Marasmius oreades]
MPRPTTSRQNQNQNQNQSSASQRATPLEGISPEVLAMGKLIATMKDTVHALHEHFNILGKEMEQVAELAPAVKAAELVDKIRGEIQKQVKDREEKIAALKRELERRVEQEIREKLYNEAKSTIKDAVQRRVSEKVGRLLADQVPNDLRVQVAGHKRQILEIQTNLHNTEARRFNSSLQSPTDSFRPLRRPALPESVETPATAVEPPTPSKKFPENLGKLWLLPLSDLKLLVQEYGVDILKPQDGSKSKLGSPTTPDSASTLVGDETELSREEMINAFMTHIGAPFRVLPAASSPVAKKLSSPLVTKVNNRPCFA